MKKFNEYLKETIDDDIKALETRLDKMHQHLSDIAPAEIKRQRQKNFTDASAKLRELKKKKNGMK